MRSYKALAFGAAWLGVLAMPAYRLEAGDAAHAGAVAVLAAAEVEATVPPAPKGLSPKDAGFPNPTTQVTLSWLPVTGAKYAVRASDETDPSLRDPRNNCANDYHYLCVNNLTATSITLPVRVGHTYNWWVHAVRDTQFSAAAIAGFSVSATSPVGYELLGSAAIVPSSTTRCDGYDIPDTAAHAYRDASGRVNLITGSEINWRSVGSSLDNVQKSCNQVFHSAWDPVYDHFKNSEWITSTYTEDGNTIFGLVHNEWYAYLSDPRCPGGPQRGYGWVNAITTIRSDDGGANYFRPADHLVSRAPVGWINGDSRFPCSEQQRTVFGSFGPSKIMKIGSYYYSMYQSEADPLGYLTMGGCLMRTRNLANGSSWQKWTLNGWDARPEAVCSPIDTGHIGKMHESITYDTHLDRFLLVGNHYAPAPGVYLSVSSDLFHWSDPMKLYPLIAADHVYPAILDPADPSRNFERPGERPYIYFSDLTNGAVLKRQQLRLIQGQAARELRVPAGASSARSANWLGGQSAVTYYGGEWIEYELQVPTTATWQVGLTGRNFNLGPIPFGYNFQIEVYVNDQYRGTISLVGDRVNYRQGSISTSLTKGLNRIRYRWTNDVYAPGEYDSNLEAGEVSVTR